MSETMTKQIQNTLKLRHEPVAFSRLERAQSWAARAVKPMRVVMGDYDDETDTGIAWVVCPADAAKLERAGYEIA